MSWVTLLDYGANNVTSVEQAFARLGAESVRATTGETLASAEAIVLPGVGHFSALIRALDEREMRGPLVKAIVRGVPFLGICLGLHALCESSEEAPGLAGLGLLPGSVVSLPRHAKLPHMGWNQVAVRGESRLLRGFASDTYFYFAHSFALTTLNGGATATCTHGTEFVAVVETKNIFAVQFHPEKSGDAGARILANFLSACA
jgi:imidazole glycerol phosphate synthase glutamine amidotransferase subunit